MAEEPDSLVLRRLTDIRTKQDEQSAHLHKIDGRLVAIGHRFDDLEREMAYALGLNTRSIVKHKEQDTRLNELVAKVEELLARR